MIELVDVSGFQPSALGYRAIAQAGIVGAMVKLTDGRSSPDSLAAQHVAGFKIAGIRAGGYHYLLVRKGAQDAMDQAREFCARYVALGCDLVPGLDCEDAENAGTTPEEWLVAIRDFVMIVEGQLLMCPLIYSYPSFWRGLGPTLADAVDIGHCPSWWAEYGPVPHPAPPWTADFPALWQYTGSGTVAGVPGKVDRSRSMLTADGLVSACSLRQPPPVAA
jgi:GH25 family lysozyme M1 (1,4-beta-N-acetylmuramidase)